MSKKADDELGFAPIGLTALFLAVVVAAVLQLGVYGVNRYHCSQVEQTTQLETKYVFTGGGCYIKPNGKWVPLSSWRNVE